MARYIDADLEVSDYVTVWDCECSEFGKQTVMSVDDLQYLPTADVAPKSEVADEIIFCVVKKLHEMMPFKAIALVNGEAIGNGVDLGKEQAIFEMLRYLDELSKKYTEGEK